MTKKRVLKPYRLEVPLVHKIKISSVDDQQDVDNDKKVVRIPEGVEASDPIKGLG